MLLTAMAAPALPVAAATADPGLTERVACQLSCRGSIRSTMCSAKSMIPMRDGVKLKTAHFDTARRAHRAPILLSPHTLRRQLARIAKSESAHFIVR